MERLVHPTIPFENERRTKCIQKPRLLVLASTYPRWPEDVEPGFVHELAKRLTDCFEVSVLCPHAMGAKTSENLDRVKVHRYRYAPTSMEVLVNDGGIVTNLRRKPWKWLLTPGFLLSMLWSIWCMVRRNRPDVIHAHWLLPQGMVIAFLQLVERRMPPFLLTSHGADLFTLNAWPLRRIKRLVVHRAAAITVVSNAMLEELSCMGIESGNVKVQPMGVDLNGRFTPDESITRSRDEILFVGRLVEKKGLRHLIDAMPAILRSCPSAYLTVVGFGPEEEERKLQAQHLGLQHSIHFTGAMPQYQLPSLYRRAAVFVAPFVQAASGDREGLGLVAVEAVGCGCPVVISDLPAVRQVFLDAAQAVFVPPADSSALASHVVRTLQCPEAAAARADAARISVIPRFDWGAVAFAYAQALRGSLNDVP